MRDPELSSDDAPAARVPFPRSYWAAERQLLAGSFPGSPDPAEAGEKLEALLDCGIRHIVNLMEDGEIDHEGNLFASYSELLIDLARSRAVRATVSRFPIRDVSSPSQELMVRILNDIDAALDDDRPTYVHCWGGRGRTGTVVGCWLARHGVASGARIIEQIESLRKLTPDAEKPSPETQTQRQMVAHWVKGA